MVNLPPWLIDFLGPLGCVTSLVLCVAPLRALMQARKQDCLGGLDTRPYTLFYATNLLWVGYTLLTADVWNFTSSALPAVLWLYFCLTAIQLLSEEEGECLEATSHLPRSGFHTVVMFKATHEIRMKELRRVEYALCAGTGIAMIIPFILVPARLPLFTGLVLEIPLQTRLLVYRSIVFVASLACYAAPLLRIWSLIKSKDASTVHAGFCVGQGFHNSIWFAFGLLKQDFALFVPQGVGVLSVSAQLILKAKYPGDHNLTSSSSKASLGDSVDLSDIKVEVQGEANNSQADEADTESTAESDAAGRQARAVQAAQAAQAARAARKGGPHRDLPDLTPRLKEMGMYEDYLKWQRDYQRWRQGHAQGAKGDIATGTATSRYVASQQAADDRHAEARQARAGRASPTFSQAAARRATAPSALNVTHNAEDAPEASATVRGLLSPAGPRQRT